MDTKGESHPKLEVSVAVSIAKSRRVSAVKKKNLSRATSALPIFKVLWVLQGLKEPNIGQHFAPSSDPKVDLFSDIFF